MAAIKFDLDRKLISLSMAGPNAMPTNRSAQDPKETGKAGPINYYKHPRYRNHNNSSRVVRSIGCN